MRRRRQVFLISGAIVAVGLAAYLLWPNIPFRPGLTEENAGSGPVGYRFRVDTNAGDLSFGVYLTALMVSVNVPEGTLTVTLSPFLCPTRARPTGESTEIRPADGSLSTAPTR